VPLISVIVPTITGREPSLDRCLRAYQDTSPDDTEIIVILDQPTCGIAWNAGAERAGGRYLHFTADDIEPVEDWWEPAVAVVEDGKTPCPMVLNSNGSLQSCGEWGVLHPDGTPTDIARVPFVSRSQWDTIGPSLETHYYTDNWVAVRAVAAGIPCVTCQGYTLIHHFDPHGRLDGSDGRMMDDYHAYLAAVGQL
jgi:glycosyltransferase involved in cell wall biosynthesis